MRSYKILFEVEFNHSYYPTGKLANGDINIVPTHETKKIIENYRLIEKQTNNKVQLIQECEKEYSHIEAVVEIDSELSFEFVIGQSNKKLFNFTDVRFPIMRKEIFYFSNKLEKTITKNGKMTKKTSVSDADIVSISKLGLAKRQSASGIIGLMKINVDKTINQTIQTNQPLQYNINFEERKTFWQYNVIEKYNKVEKTTIIDEENKIKFKEKKTETPKTKVFISETKLPIRKINNQKFKLISSNGKSKLKKTMREKLPCPEIRNIINHEELENEYIAVTNIYI